MQNLQIHETMISLKAFIINGGNRKKKDHNGLSTLDEIAKELNMSTTNLKRALRIERNLTDLIKELLKSQFELADWII